MGGGSLRHGAPPGTSIGEHSRAQPVASQRNSAPQLWNSGRPTARSLTCAGPPSGYNVVIAPDFPHSLGLPTIGEGSENNPTLAHEKTCFGIRTFFHCPPSYTHRLPLAGFAARNDYLPTNIFPTNVLCGKLSKSLPHTKFSDKFARDEGKRAQTTAIGQRSPMGPYTMGSPGPPWASRV